MKLPIGLTAAGLLSVSMVTGLVTSVDLPPWAAPLPRPFASRAFASPQGALPAPTPRGPASAAQSANVAYNADFTFSRVRYGSRRGGDFGRGWGGSAWAHDYPNADRNMQVMLSEFTAMRANTSGSNVFDLEDPEIFRNPILYVSEPGFWQITPEGAANLREYLLKGGFLMFDDFEARQWDNMAYQMAQALPEGQWVDIDERHPIFSTFFWIEDIYVPHPSVRVTPRYRVIFEDNDPNGRVMVLANHNSDLAEYWEYAATGYFPVDPTNDAFRLGINYLVYAVTH
jgi:hypothetical protein